MKTRIAKGFDTEVAEVLSLAVGGSVLYAGTYGGVIHSTNNGTTWSRAKVGNVPVTLCLTVSGANLYAGTFSGVYLSTDSGASWTSFDTGLTNGTVRSLAAAGMNLFAGTDGGLFISSINEACWSGQGLTNSSVYSLAVSGTYLFAGTDNSGVWRRPLSEMITSVASPSPNLPGAYKLDQNDPNPFNPSTTIRYALPQRSHVTLSVFNTLGQQVATLVNENEEAGYRDVRFDGTGLASGVYFYRLQAGEYVATKKLLILK